MNVRYGEEGDAPNWVIDRFIYYIIQIMNVYVCFGTNIWDVEPRHMYAQEDAVTNS